MWSSGGESGQPDAPSWPGAASGGGGPNQNQPTWPSPANPGPGGWGSPSPAPAPQRSLEASYTDTLPNGVHDKLLITVTGTVNSNASRFSIDLLKGDDIAFHFNPRFIHKEMVVTNCRIRGKWGEEERALGRFPFVRGRPFKLEIRCSPSEFKVAVDGSHLLSYKHRITDLKSITSIGINKDLKLTSVQMKTEN